jgi:hypothetical protein
VANGYKERMQRKKAHIDARIKEAGPRVAIIKSTMISTANRVLICFVIF